VAENNYAPFVQAL